MNDRTKLAGQLDIRVSGDVHDRLRALAANRRGGISAIVRDAIALHIGLATSPLQPERPEIASLGALPVGAAVTGESLIEIIVMSHGDTLAMAIAGLENLAAAYRQLAVLGSLRPETRTRMTRLAEEIEGAASAGRFRQGQTQKTNGE